MPGLSTITVDLARGEVGLGGRRVVLTAVSGAAAGTAARAPARFRLDDGAVVRLIAFGERSRLVRTALADNVPSQALVTLLRAAAHEGPSSTVTDAVMLAMAGGAEDAPDFDRCAVEAARLQACSWLSVHDTPAIVVDRAIIHPREPEPSGAWNRFVFPGADTRELEALLNEMVASLLTRGMPATTGKAVTRRGIAPHDAAPVTTPITTAKSVARSSTRAQASSTKAVASPDTLTTTPPVHALPDSAARAGAASRDRLPASSIRASRKRLHLRETETATPDVASASTPGSTIGLPSATTLPAAPRRSRTAGWPARLPAAPVSRSLPARGSVESRPADDAASPALVFPGAAVPPTWDARSVAASRPTPVHAFHSTVPPQPLTSEAAAVTGAILSRADLVDEIGQALAAECDLRGLDT